MYIFLLKFYEIIINNSIMSHLIFKIELYQFEAAQAPHAPVIRLKTSIRLTPAIRLRKTLQSRPSVQTQYNCVSSMMFIIILYDILQ